MDAPGELIPGKFEHLVTGWPQIGVKVSPQMKAHLIEALHQEGWTLNTSEYVRVIVAKHVAAVLGMSAAEVLHSQPSHGSKKGSRYVRVG